MNATNNITVIGMDLGGTKLNAGLVKNGKILKTFRTVLPQDKISTDAQAIIDLVIDTIAQLITPNVKAIGVGVPSVVDRKNGIVYDVQNIPSWQEIPLKKILEKKFKIPVFIDNDANCFALGEKFYGKGKNYHHFVGITIGTGIGGGVIINDHLLPDNNCGSGEFGEMYYLDARVEDYCGGLFFKNKYDIDGKELDDLARADNTKALRIFKEFGYHLGRAIKMIMCAIDPQAIIIGGSIANSRKFFETAMCNEIANFTYPRSAKRLKIEFSTTKNSPILGAAAICLDKI
ncbi:MAG: ROK family protein [Gammaproteobacteria bacterium]|jgi:glucokinase